LLVTRDSKSDWFLRIKGKMVSALPALIREALDYGQIEFTAMATRTFLINAQSFLNTPVSAATLRQAEAVGSPAGKDLRPLHIERSLYGWLVRDVRQEWMNVLARQMRLERERDSFNGVSSEDMDRGRLTEILDELNNVNKRLDELRSLRRRLEIGSVGDEDVVVGLSQAGIADIRDRVNRYSEELSTSDPDTSDSNVEQIIALAGPSHPDAFMECNP
jgi:hypothetical protein